MLKPTVWHIKNLEFVFEGEQVEFQEDFLPFPCQTLANEGTPTLAASGALGGHMPTGTGNKVTV